MSSLGPHPAPVSNEQLLALLSLEEQARMCPTLKELQFLITNETHCLIPYRQAILLSKEGQVISLSGLTSVEKEAPFMQWLKRNVLKHATTANVIKGLSPSDIDESEAKEWSKWLPKNMTICPVISPFGERCGTLILARREPIEESINLVLNRLMACYGHAWSIFLDKKKYSSFSFKTRKTLWIVVVAVCIIGALPIDISALAPAEIVPFKPVIVRAPLNGVVDKIDVQPNQDITPNQILFRLDTRSLQGELAISKKAFESLIAQYKQTARKAMSDSKSKIQLPILAGKMKEQEASITRLKELIERATVRAQTKGTVVIDNVTDWNGRPVSLGERVLMIADARQVEVEAWLPSDEAIDLPVNALGKVFLNADPLNPIEGKVRLYSYEAQLLPSGILAYRVRLTLNKTKQVPRIGLRGTARLKGQEVSLAYWIFRRPISEIRQFFGL